MVPAYRHAPGPPAPMTGREPDDKLRYDENIISSIHGRSRIFGDEKAQAAMITAAQTPLYEIKANLFKALAHPARIRVLELLSAAPDHSAPVSYLLSETGLEASHLSQHLATLRRHGVVTSSRSANAVTYRLAHPKIAELLAIARTFLLDRLADSNEQLKLAQGLPSEHLTASDS